MMLSNGPDRNRDRGDRVLASKLDVRYFLAPSRPHTRSEIPSPSSESPREAPVRARPTESWTYRWLGVQVAGGLAAGIAFGVGVATLSTILLAASTSAPVTILCLALATLDGALPLLALREEVARAKKIDCRDNQTQQRMARIVDSLCLRAGKEIHRVIPVGKFEGVLGMLDGPGNQNILLYDPQIASALHDRQLEAVVAHEIAHADQASNGGERVLWGLSRFAKQVAGVGSFSFFLSTGVGLPIACCGALCHAQLAGMVLSMCLNIASRAEEIRTDIRAVQLTRDLGSLAEALETIHELIGFDDLPRFPQTLFSLSTHPSPSMRARWVRRACGNPQPASSHLRSGWLRSFR